MSQIRETIATKSPPSFSSATDDTQNMKNILTLKAPPLICSKGQFKILTLFQK